jgi:hypothetical protein
MVHFLVFTVLAVLICASRWPVRRGLLAGVLVAFALAQVAQSRVGFVGN